MFDLNYIFKFIGCFILIFTSFLWNGLYAGRIYVCLFVYMCIRHKMYSRFVGTEHYTIAIMSRSVSRHEYVKGC